MLLAAGADPNIRDREGNLPIQDSFTHWSDNPPVRSNNRTQQLILSGSIVTREIIKEAQQFEEKTRITFANPKPSTLLSNFLLCGVTDHTETDTLFLQ